jgi:HAD superfamily hydrolase (TIGR01509 family)
MIKGAIFDFDGTLFDSMFIWDRIGSDYLRSIGYEPQADLDQVFKSMSLYQAACYYKSEYGVKASTDEIIGGVNKMLEHFYIDEVQPKEGVRQFIRKLQDKGVKMCISTATDEYLVKAALKRCDMEFLFSRIFTCSSVGHGKDEPDIFRTAMHHLGTEKNETFVFEDAIHAIRTAKNDGFPVAGVYDKSEEKADEVKKLSDIYLPDYSDFDGFWKAESVLGS